MHHDDANVWKGLVAGLAGGSFASWTMNQSQAAWIASSSKLRETTRCAIDAAEPGFNRKTRLKTEKSRTMPPSKLQK